MRTSNTENVLIIGAGPAGIMAAISAGERGIKALIIEKNQTIGKKILVSGNGRCNLTNDNFDLNKYHGDKAFLKKVFDKFDKEKLVDFFHRSGVKFKKDEFGRILPVTDQAVTILNCLIDELNYHLVKINCCEEVIKITKDIKNFIVETNRSVYIPKKVILSVGGCSYPQMGSTRKGFELARRLGHRIIEPKPALVAIELKGNWFHMLQGVKAETEINIKTKSKSFRYCGELLFTKYGISGPVTLDSSRGMLDYYGKEDTEIYLNLIPGFEDVIKDNFKVVSKNRPDKTVSSFLAGVLHKKIPLSILPIIGINPDKKCSELSISEKQNILNKLQHWPIEVKGPRPFTESMVTAGGVSTSEVSPETMESKLVKGLYFAGEILDIDGESGGYNMQFAFSTGWIAGEMVEK